MKMTKADQRDIFLKVQEGDIFEHGALFTTMAPDEKFVWKIEEAVDDPKRGGFRRVTIRLYLFDVFFKTMVVSVSKAKNSKTVHWLTGSVA